MDLLINPIVKNFLITKLEDNNNLNQSLLFWGESDLGKLTTAKLFAKSLLCATKEFGGCDQCENCTAFDNQWHPDYLIIDFRGDSTKVRDTEKIFEFLLYKPQLSQKRVLIINNCEKITISAQSSLLKILEEPKNHITIILVTTNPQKLLKTINSRLLAIRFAKPKSSDIMDFVKNKYQTDSKNLSRVLELSQNHPAKIINYLKNPEALKTTENNIKFLNNLAKNNFCGQSKLIKELMTSSVSKEEFALADEKEKFVKTNLKKMINDWIDNTEREIYTSLIDDNILLASKIKQLKNSVQLLSYVDSYNANYRLLLEVFCITTF